MDKRDTMGAEPFGAFGEICRRAPLPQCNLFFAQYWRKGSDFSVLFPPSSPAFSFYNITSNNVRDDTTVQLARRQAGAGLGAACQIPRPGQRGSAGDFALVIVSAMAILIMAGLIYHAARRKAAVGRIEMRVLLIGFALHSALQALTMASMLEHGSTALLVLSAIHCGVIAMLAWLLIANLIIVTQVVEDGSLSSLIPIGIVSAIIFGGTLYIGLATGYGWNDPFIFYSDSNPALLKNTALFVITLIWPLAAIVVYISAMVFLIVRNSYEVISTAYLGGSAVLFFGGQLALFLANTAVCEGAHAKTSAAFIAAITNTAAVGLLHMMWHSVTEETWEDYY